jgi:excinuclease ABC subunit A
VTGLARTVSGTRLRPEVLAVTIDGNNIIEITDWPVLHTLEWVRRLAKEKGVLTSRQEAISTRILKEIESRLGFLVDVGLDYLTLRRSAGTCLAAKRSVSAWLPKSDRA